MQENYQHVHKLNWMEIKPGFAASKQISSWDPRGWVSEQCFTSPPTQYRLYGRRFLQIKRPNQQYQSTEADATKYKENNENN